LTLSPYSNLLQAYRKKGILSLWFVLKPAIEQDEGHKEIGDNVYDLS